jgi:flagella basal body P-ring formation protein FlgA
MTFARGLSRNLAWAAVAAALAALLAAPATARETARETAQDTRAIAVRILPRPEVAGETFTLGEVAEFDGFDVPAIAELAKLALGRSPAPGRSLPLSELFLRSKLAGHPRAADVRIEAPKGAAVTRAGQTVKAAETEQRVMAFALKESKLLEEDMKQEVLASVPDIHLPLGALEWEVALLGKHLAPGGDRTYQVIARVDGKEAWRGMVRLRQKVYQTVVQAVRPIRRDQIIGPEDVAPVRRVAPPGREGGWLKAPRQAVGKLAKRPIGADEVLTESSLHSPMAVAEGGRVTLVFETDALRMAVPGVAMTAAQAGQFIPVRNLQSGRIVHGVVMAEGTVRVN